MSSIPRKNPELVVGQSRIPRAGSGCKSWNTESMTRPQYIKLILLGLLVAPFAVSSIVSQGVLSTMGSDKTTKLRLMSFNVRYDSKPDDITVQQSLDSLSRGVPSEPSFYGNATEQPWSTRRLYVANDILFNGADLFGKLTFPIIGCPEADIVQVVRSCSRGKSMILMSCSVLSTDGLASVETTAKRLVSMKPSSIARKHIPA